jgi:hypothetical protein
MQYSMNCDFEAEISSRVTCDQLEEADQPILMFAGIGIDDSENTNRSSDVWFD